MKKFAPALLIALVAMLITGSAFAAAPQPAKDQFLKFNVGAEPEKLDPALSTGIPEANIELALFEGLTRLDENGNPVTGIAKSWEIKDKGLTYIFHLRTAAKWSNGDPVTAHDFEYSWKRVLDPKTASEYAYQMFYIKGAEEYNAGKAKADAVAVKALDQWTLEVKLNTATPYFLGLTAFHSYYPVHRKTVEKYGASWHTKPETIIGNGPFKMVKWVHNTQIDMVKNPYYWDAANVKLNNLTFTLIDNQATELTMWETGQLDITDRAPVTEIPRLRREGKLKIAPYLGTYYYMFNVTAKPFDDVRVRKALALAIDRELLVENVTRAGEQAALAYVPSGLPDAKKGSDFRKVGGNYYEDNNVKLAKQLLAEAGYPDGKGFPKAEILYNTLDSHKKIAEAIQEMWKKNLGINVTLTNQEWQIYLDARDKLDYTIARAGWIGDFADPMTFIDMWTTGNGNNDTGWSNKEYDRLIDVAKSTSDPNVRMKAMHDAEKILMDEMPIMPIYFYTRPYNQHPHVQGVVRTVLGQVDFKTAWRAVK